MNWPVIGLLITFIFVLLCFLYVAVYTIIQLGNNAKTLMQNLNYYQELANKYGLQLTRIGEGIKEFENVDYIGMNASEYDDDGLRLISNIKSLVKIVGR
jgi:predicted PurR-regulated permease PerM